MQGFKSIFQIDNHIYQVGTIRFVNFLQEKIVHQQTFTKYHFFLVVPSGRYQDFRHVSNSPFYNEWLNIFFFYSSTQSVNSYSSSSYGMLMGEWNNLKIQH